MRPKDAITINGVMLSEYLKDQNDIEEEIKSKEVIKDGFDKVYLNRYIKDKYKEQREENGKVKILGKFEINRANFDDYMKRFLKVNNIYVITVLILIAYDRSMVFTVNKMADVLFEFGKKHAIAISKNIGFKLRITSGRLKRSAFFDCIDYTFKNNKAPASFRVKEEYIDRLTIDEAIELALKKKYKTVNEANNAIMYGKRVEDTADATPKKELKIAPPKAEVTLTDTEPLEKSIADSVVNALKNMSTGNGPLFTIQGDVHIHINISK